MRSDASDIKLQTVCECVSLYSAVVFNEWCSYHSAERKRQLTKKAQNFMRLKVQNKSDVMETQIQLWTVAFLLTRKKIDRKLSKMPQKEINNYECDARLMVSRGVQEMSFLEGGQAFFVLLENVFVSHAWNMQCISMEMQWNFFYCCFTLVRLGLSRNSVTYEATLCHLLNMKRWDIKKLSRKSFTSRESRLIVKDFWIIKPKVSRSLLIWIKSLSSSLVSRQIKKAA